MYLLYVSFGSKVRRRTFGCVAMCSTVLFILRSRLLLYSAVSGVNRVWYVCCYVRKKALLQCLCNY